MGGIASLLLCLLISAQWTEIASALKFGINYGQLADNLPAPTQVVSLLQSMNVNRVKLYDADTKVLSAFSGSNIEFIISVSNGNMSAMTDSSQAKAWVAEYVQPYIAGTRITCILVGNEVLTGKSTTETYLIFLK
ncbi:putative O-glycosyl hydrolase family 17 protein [Carex littledalei]|uniref:Putative O-glycosyl hydrolase family 17 protein n=1 Tax=Carex littledalei TaxID=544730 RepID=A0A833R520_9POAL|nr:putative O-glycosyl hydrolase family 17 protein [Carex littledalei]